MDDLLDLETRDLLELLARRGRGPAVGSAAALVTATAAALVAKAARTSVEQWEDAGGAAAQAEALRARAAPLAQADADAYAAAVERLDAPGETDADPGRRDFRLRRALDTAAVIPLRIAATAADVAELASEVAVRGNQNLRADATGAAILAEAAARTAAHLVEVNLAVGPEDERVRQARAHAVAAAAAAARLL